MRIKSLYLISLFFLVLFIIACKKEISQEQAITITQDFVNNQVRFTQGAVAPDNAAANASQKNITLVNKADIIIKDIKKLDGLWQLGIVIRSPENKTATLLFLIDSKDGTIVRWGKPETFQLKD